MIGNVPGLNAKRNGAKISVARMAFLALVIDDYSVFYHHSDEQITVLVLWDNRRNPARLAYTLRNQDPKYLNEPMAPYGEQTDPTNVKD